MKSQVDVLYLFHGEGHGGDAKVVLRLARALKVRGYHVLCAISPSQKHSEDFRKSTEEQGIRCDLVPYFEFNRSSSRLSLAWTLYAYLLKTRPKVLHLHTGDSFVHRSMAIVIWLAIRARKVATLHWITSASYTSPRHIADQAFSERFFYSTVVPSAYSRREYVRDCKGRVDSVITINNLSLTTEDISPDCDGIREAVRSQLGISKNARIVLFASLLNERKRPLDAINAFCQMRNLKHDDIMLIAGSGNLEAPCKHAALQFREQIRFLGYRNDVPQLMIASDVHILPSDSESFGLSVLDAMALGLPNVVYDVPPLRELLDDCGVLCSPRDVRSLSEGLASILADSGLREQLAHRGKCRAIEQYLELPIQRHLALYGFC